jgi:hypothetical protein
MGYQIDSSRSRHHPSDSADARRGAVVHRRSAVLIGLLLLSLLVTFFVQLPHLVDRYQVAKDAQVFYWMARYQDLELFPVDPLRHERYVAELNLFGYPLLILPRSLGYGLLFWAGSFIIDHIWLMKLLGFVLMPVCVIYLFKLGELVTDEFTGVVLGLVFAFVSLASPRSTAIASGLQRAFAIPLLIAFTYYLHRKRYWLASTMILVSLLFYYPNFLIALLTYGLSMIEINGPLHLHLDISRRRLIPLLLTLFICLGLVTLTVIVESPSRFLPKDVPVSQSSRYQSGGPQSLFISFPWFGRAGIFDMGGDVVNFLMLTASGILIYTVLGKRCLRRAAHVFGHLLLASLILYAASFFVLWKLSSTALYLPSRYTRATLIWVALGSVSVNVLDFFDRLPGWLHRNIRLVVFFVTVLTASLAVIYTLFPSHFPGFAGLFTAGLFFGGVSTTLGIGACVWIVRYLLRHDGHCGKTISSWIALAVIVAVITPLAATHIDRLGMKRINPSPAERAIYRFLAALPTDTVIAGDPQVMDGVPLFSKRSVLFKKLQTRSDAPVVEFFDAYYAESVEKIVAFCQSYDVDYLVIDRSDFSMDLMERQEFFSQPYNDAIVELLAGRSGFVAPELEPIFVEGSMAVVRCDLQTLLGGD